MYLPRVIRPEVMLSYVWRNALFFVAYDTATTSAYHLGYEFIALPFTPVGTLGMAVAIVVGFHNNSAYDRWCEAHAVWRQLQADSRNFAAAALGLLPAGHACARRLVHRRLAGVKGLRNLLRGERFSIGLSAHLAEEELAGLSPEDLALPRLARLQAQELGQACRSEQLSDEEVALLIGHVERFQELATECVITDQTPLPRQYGFVTQVFVWVFVLLLPMGFMAELGWGTIPLSVLLSITFVTLEQVGRLTENPYDEHMNDVPIDAMTRQIERELAGLMDEDLPPQLQPVRGVLM